MSFSEFVEVSLQCDDESHKGFEIIPEKKSLNDLGIEYNDTGNGTRVVNSELMVESVCGESESRKMTRNVKRKLLFEEDPDSSVWNPERKRDGKSLGVSEPPIIALHAPCSFKDYCVSAGWKVTLSEGESTASYCSPTGRIYDSVSKVVEVPSLQVRKSENAQSGSCLSLDNLKPCDSCPLKKTYSRRKPLIRKFTSQVDSDEEVASKHTTILAGKPKAGKEGNGVTEVETGICESIPEVVEALSQHVPKSKNAQSGSYQSVDSSKPCDSRPIWNTYNRRKPLIKKITEEMDKGKEVSPKHKSILGDKLKAGKEGNGVTEVETGICESHPEVVEALPQQFSKSVVDSELMDESVSRCSGGLDLDKRHKDMSNQFIREDNPLEVCGESESREMNKNMKRKLLLEEDPDWSRIRDRKSLGVSEPPIVALHAPCSFKDYCVSAGWKVTLSEGDGTASYCSPAGGIYDSPSKVVEVLSLQVRKSENDQSGSYLSLDSLKPCDSSSLKNTYSRRKPLIRKFTSQGNSDEEVTSKHMTILAGKPKAGKEGNGVTEIETGICESLPEVVKALSQQVPNSENAQSGSYQSVDDSKPRDSRTIWNTYNRRKPLIREMTTRMDKGKEVSPKHKSILAGNLKARKEGNGVTTIETGICESLPEVVVSLSQQVLKSKNAQSGSYQSGDNLKPGDSRPICNTYNRRKPLVRKITTQTNKGKEASPKYKSILAGKLKAGKEGNGGTEIKTLYSFKDSCVSAGWKVTLSEGDSTSMYFSRTGDIYDSHSKVVEALSQQVPKSVDDQFRTCQSVDHSKPCELKPLVRELTTQIDSGEEVSPEHIASLVGKPKAGEEDNGVTDMEVGDDNMKQSVEDECLSNEKSSSECGSGVTTAGDCDRKFQHPRRSPRVGKPKAGEEDNGVTDMKVGDDNMKQSVEDECLSNEKSSSECGSGVTTAGDCDRKFQHPRRSPRVNGRHVAIDFELGSRRWKRINGRHDLVDILELENLSRSPEAYDKENDKEVSQRSGRMKVKEMNEAMSSHVNKEKSGDEKIKQSMEDECLNYEKSSSDCGSGVVTTGDWDRELQDPQRSTRIEGRHVAADFELGPRMWKGVNGKHGVVDILELKNLPCSPEVYDTENVKKPPIVALPDPCSSKNVCLSAGWKVTLPEGDGTTIYCSPAGGLYDSLSNVAEAVSQQVLSSEDAQSGSYQSIDHSKPCELKPLVRELTMQKDSGEEVSPKHMTSLVAKPKAGEKDNGVTDMKVGDDNTKQSLEDECLSNEKSSSECGSGVTTTGDCDGEFQGPRRSTRIKGRHVAVDFELGPRRQKEILDQDERGSSCTEGTCVSSESAASERRYLNGSQIPVDGENMGVCEVGDCIYTSSCASTRLSKENQPCTVSKDDICESHSSRINDSLRSIYITENLDCRSPVHQKQLKIDVNICKQKTDEAKILASKRSSLSNNTFARKRISIGGNGSSSSKTKRKRSTNHEQNDQHKTVINVFSWLINAGTVVENSKVVYTIKNGKGNKLKGSFTRRGIRCYCCREVLSLFEFEAHAGSNLHQPWNKICLASGKSLMQCQNEAWEKEKKLKKIGLEVVSLNDEICAVCVDGGDLILCDGCPSSFHQDCLKLQSRPEGNWYCPFCTCTFCMRADCGQVKGSGTGLFNCTQCGCKYGAACMQESDSEKMGPKSVVYCGKSCEKVDYGLLRILGTKHPMGKGFSWTLLRRRDEETAEGSCERQSHIVECNVKLSLARVLLDECFASCEDSSTGIDKISQAVYSCGPNGEGFYTVILEKFEEMVSAATIRIHGTRVAEIPFIGTRHIYRKRGMCRLLLRSIEEVLYSLQVKKLIIHAIPDLLETWMKSFAFRQVEPSDEDETKKLKLMRFFGLPLLQKTIYDGNQVEESSNEVQSSCSQESEDVFLQALLEMDIDPKYINTSLW